MARQTDTLWGDYKIIQDDRFFKLGQDSVLLSDFALPKKSNKIADLGCGNGAISLLLCASHPNISIVGLELQQEVADLAKENAALNGFEQRFSVVCGDIKASKALFQHGSMDYVVSNPPYFAVGAGISVAENEIKTARQEDACTLKDLFQAAAYLLKFGGRFAMVHKPERLTDILFELRQSKIEAKRLRFVHKNSISPPSSVLIEGRKGSSSGITVMPPLILQKDDGTPTEELKKIYHR